MYHLKLVWRQILRQKSYLVINTIGLAIALAASILIYTYLMKEWQTDAFHEKRDHIYRITTQSTGYSYWDSEVCSPLGELAKAEIPDVLDYTRIITARELKLRWEDSDHYQGGITCGYADRQLFSMFTFPLISGELRESMQPGWAVISETVARRYFKDENPVGKLLYLENLYTSGKESSFYIAGIMKDFPVRSSIQADVILDFSVIEEMFRYSAGNTIRTFLLLTDHADIHKTEEQLQEIEYREAEYVRERGKEFRLQPLREMYLHSDHIQNYDIPFAQGSGTFNLILSGIVLLILILAFCNYLIMKLAQAHKNAERFAIQKYFGISNRSMLSQILLEIGIYLLGALILTIVLVVILYPYFIQIISPLRPFPFYLTFPEIMGFLAIFLVFIGSVGGVTYGYVTRKMNISGIKSTMTSSRSFWEFKHILLIAQLTIFCALLFFSIVFVKQISFLQDKPLGYNNHNTITFGWPNPLEVISLKEELSGYPDILSTSNGALLPIGNWAHWDIHLADQPEKVIQTFSLLCDENYIDTYQIKLVEGRDAKSKVTTTEIYSVKPVDVVEIVVNQAFVRKLGLSHPIGTLLENNHSKLQIVGVVQDFHFRSLHEPIQPAMLGSDLPGVLFSVIVRYREGKRNEVIEHLKQIHEARHPEKVFYYRDFPYSELYEKEITLGQLIYIFTGIALLIGGMGVLAFSIFITESKTKEIALRKVNGASEKQIMICLNRIFVKQVAIACLIGIPCSYLLCRIWLQDFAYKIKVDSWITVSVVCLSLLFITLITIWQVRRASRKNPIDAIKTE